MSDVQVPALALRIPPQAVYPERRDKRESWLDRLGTAVEGLAVTRGSPVLGGWLRRIVPATNAYGAEMAAASDQELRAIARQLRVTLRQGKPDITRVARTFALVREVAERTVGLRHYDVQLIGGFALYKGMVAEMQTGEGKTLAATLPVCAAALGGIPVHVITVNDYLARRDAELMGPIYRFLGLSVGTVLQGMMPHDRRRAYECDITYCNNKEIAFDYLRDRMSLGSRSGNLRLKFERLYGEESRSHRLLLRGLHFAIVDEADSVLVDEARTPLIITGETQGENEQVMAQEALALVGELVEGRDYRIHLDERRVELTSRGKNRLFELTERLGESWDITVLREEMARMAVAALFLFRRDEHYLVNDGKVEIIDEYTGRIMPDRYWSDGLHQLIEVKEGCEASGRRHTLGRITYQRFFRRYRRLAGMTGTAREAASEMWAVYRLPVVSIPNNRPLRRRRLRDRMCRNAETKWRVITSEVARLHDQGRPVLLGTRSVATSERASAHLNEAALPHVVLNAAQDRDEAEIIARAGERGRITIATNMAGRGTDIRLGKGIAELGGLHVIMSERHDARRIDRQLAGRCGRQGDPGSVQAILSLDDPLLEMAGNEKVRRTALALAPTLGDWIGRLALFYAQARAERLHSRMRRELMKMDRNLGNMLAFSGQME